MTVRGICARPLAPCTHSWLFGALCGMLQRIPDGDCPADADTATVGRGSAAESIWHVEQQFRGAVQRQFGGHQLGKSAFPDQFTGQPVSIP
jgi:hypothetical protein